MTHPSQTHCRCEKPEHDCHFIAVTGGPGAGKTAVLEIAKRTFCRHVAVLPEAASIIYGGGFWRSTTSVGRKAVQRAIYHVGTELERLAREEKHHGLALCDRGTVDGLAYWPEKSETFWRELNTSKEKELAKYSAVIHLRTPSPLTGYNQQNPLRTESPEEAIALDHKIERVWESHPRRFIIESEVDFVEKVAKTLDLVRNELPPCCRVD